MDAFLQRLVVAAMACAIFLLSGCQSLEERAVDPEISAGSDQDTLAKLIQQREAALDARTTFQVDGGLGIWTDTETISARLDWQQSSDGLNLTLAGPLGMGTLHLIDDGTLVTLRRGDKNVAQGRLADNVLQQGLGLEAPIPVRELGFWIRGLPGNATAVVRDNEGKLSSLRYRDTRGTHWQARFLRYSAWDGLDIPSLITASGGPYSVRLRLKDWQYAATTIVPGKPESNNRLPIPSR